MRRRGGVARQCDFFKYFFEPRSPLLRQRKLENFAISEPLAVRSVPFQGKGNDFEKAQHSAEIGLINSIFGVIVITVGMEKKAGENKV